MNREQMIAWLSWHKTGEACKYRPESWSNFPTGHIAIPMEEVQTKCR